MATLYKQLSATPIPTPLPNAILTYNFDNVTISGKSTDPLRYKNIDLSFPEYSTYINTKTNSLTINNQLLSTLTTIPTSTNITYYDTIIKSTKTYKINYIHVGASPININNPYCWCIMLDLSSTTSDTLIIIIPITINLSPSSLSESDLLQKENSDFGNLIYNCNNFTTKQFNINTFVLSTNFTTFYNTANTATNRVIILNSSISTYFYDIVNRSRTNFTTLYITNLFKSSTIYIGTLKTITQTIYWCPKIPLKQTAILKNDIYIDCYKVGESDKIVGGITNPLKSVLSIKKDNSDTSLAFFGLLLAFILLYILYRMIKMITCKTLTPTIRTGGAF